MDLDWLLPLSPCTCTWGDESYHQEFFSCVASRAGASGIHL